MSTPKRRTGPSRPAGSNRRPRVAGLRRRDQPNATRENTRPPEQPETDDRSAVATESAPEEEPADAADPADQAGPEPDADPDRATAAAGPAETDDDADETSTAADAAEPDDEPEEPTPAADAEPETAVTVAELPGEQAPAEPVADAAPDLPEPADDARRSGKRLAAALAAGAVVCAGLAVWFGVEAYTTYFTGPAANGALVSAGETSEVNGQVKDAVEKLFSYDFNDTAKTERAAKDLLVGSAVQKYDDLFAVVKQQAPQQQLIVTTTVKSSAVTWLQGDRAEVLLFVDQHAMRANNGQSNDGPAQLSVGVEKQGDRWKIDRITLR